MASIVVVGGGVAGLTCAWRLRRAGHEVEVLEREAVAGGRMRSERIATPRGDFVVDRGAQFVASGYRNMQRVVDALGLRSRLHPVAKTSNAILRDGVLHPGDYGSLVEFARSRLLSAGAKLRLPRLLFEIVRHRRRLDPYHPERAAAIDREDLATGLARIVGEEAAEYLFAPAFSSTFDADPEDLSTTFALLGAKFVLSGFRLLAFDGGIGLLTQTLAEQVNVRTGCEVIAVETGADGARVTYRQDDREGRVLADAAVVALPGSLVAGVVASLTPEEKSFFARVRYVRGMVCFLMTERAPATLPWYGVAFPRREDVGLYGLAVDHHKPRVAPAGAGLLNAALTASAAERLRDAPDAAVVAHVVESLARTPVGRLDPVATAVHRWDPMLPLFYAGYLPQLAAFHARRERSPRLAFAGDYLIGPYTEMALTSGMRAATELARSLAPPHGNPDPDPCSARSRPRPSGIMNRVMYSPASADGSAARSAGGIVQLLALPGFLAFFVVSMWVGIRLLLLWTRTRQTPELLMGIGVLGIGPLGFGIAMAGILSAQTSPNLARLLVAIASTTIAVGVAANFVFNWLIYHPRSRAVKGVVYFAIAMLGVSIVGDGLTNRFAPDAWHKPGFAQLRQIAQVGAMLWASAESFGWYRRMNRRVAIGLGDALVANRFLLWSIGAGTAGLGSAIGIAVGILTGRQMTEMPAVTLMLSLAGLTAASALWLGFVPPARYVAWIRAQDQNAST